MKVYLLEKRFHDGESGWGEYVNAFTDPGKAKVEGDKIDKELNTLRQSPEPIAGPECHSDTAWQVFDMIYGPWSAAQDFRGCTITELDVIE